MPEWLKALLMAHGTLGFADSLQSLVGVPMQYEQIQSHKPGLAGNYRQDAQGQSFIGLTPFAISNFDKRGMSRPGYNAADPEQKFGDYVLAHEFGHAATYGGPLAAVLSDEVAVQGDREVFADNFQQAIQFLRSGQVNYKTLPKQSQAILGVLLQQPIYSQHPINKTQAFSSFVQRPQ